MGSMIFIFKSKTSNEWEQVSTTNKSKKGSLKEVLNAIEDLDGTENPFIRYYYQLSPYTKSKHIKAVLNQRNKEGYYSFYYEFEESEYSTIKETLIKKYPEEYI